MADDIRLLVGARGLALLVPGTDPAEVHARALAYAPGNDLVIEGGPDAVCIRSMRAIGWCSWSCAYCGPDGLHYVPARAGSLGVVTAGFVPCRQAALQEHARPDASPRKDSPMLDWRTVNALPCPPSWRAVFGDDSPRGYVVRPVPAWLMQEASETDRETGQPVTRTRVIAACVEGAELVPVDSVGGFWGLASPEVLDDTLAEAAAEHRQAEDAGVVPFRPRRAESAL
ncbi:hypothetical protein [Planomonospora algeriensis]